MGLIKSKKAIFFTSMTIILLSLFILSSAFFSGYALRKSVQKRVESLSEFVSATEEDLPRQLFISGFRIIFLMEKEIIDSGAYSSESVSDVFQEAFFSDTMYGQPTSIPINTFDEIEALVQKRASTVGAVVEMYDPVLTVGQEDPWNVKMTLTASFYVSDANGLASWNKTLVSVAMIPVENFTDPLYHIGSGGVIPDKKIVQTPHTTFDINAFNDHVDNSYYKASIRAPSFIDRLEGNVGIGSPYGIESLVNLDELVNKGGSAGQARSIVDYLFFAGSSAGHCLVSGATESWAELDNNHLGDYGVGC